MKKSNKTILLIILLAIIALGMLGFNRLPISQNNPSDNRDSGDQTIDGVKCGASEFSAMHIHSHLTILKDGQPILIPADVGHRPGCLYWLHTHDGRGVIHIESPVQTNFSLGQFFDIWGQPLSKTRVLASQNEPIHFYVNGQEYQKDPRLISLGARDEITIQIGKTVPAPKSYSFAPGE